MPRKAFVADLNEAIKTPNGNHVYDLKQGDDDGTFTFKHKVLGGDSPEVTVQALIPGMKAQLQHRIHLSFPTQSHVLTLNRCI